MSMHTGVYVEETSNIALFLLIEKAMLPSDVLLQAEV